MKRLFLLLTVILTLAMPVTLYAADFVIGTEIPQTLKNDYTFSGTITNSGAVTNSSTLTQTGTATFAGVATFNGNMTLGNATTDTVTLGATLSGLRVKINRQTGTAYTATATDDVIIMTTTAASTVYLPAVASAVGKIYMIGRGTVTGTNAITIDPNGSETIDGSTTYTSIDATGDAITIVSDGTEWIIVGKQVD